MLSVQSRREKAVHPLMTTFTEKSLGKAMAGWGMEQLTREQTPAFLARFHAFQNGLLRSIEIRYREGGAPRAVLAVATHDAEGSRDDGWVTVLLHLDDVREFRLQESSETAGTPIHHGLHVSWFDGLLAVDVGSLEKAPENLSAQRTSEFYLCGRSLAWSVGRF
jgi:hypothetical protein